MEVSIQENKYYQNRLFYGNAGSYPDYDLHKIQKTHFTPPQKIKKIKLTPDKKKKIKLSAKAMNFDIDGPSLSKDIKPVQEDSQPEPVKLKEMEEDDYEEEEEADYEEQSGGGNIKRIFLTADVSHDDNGQAVDFSI
jgi:hypothetical protein